LPTNGVVQTFFDTLVRQAILENSASEECAAVDGTRLSFPGELRLHLSLGGAQPL
jgi:hypothetical protein